jgi:D-threo-aldose 1-dehydrogenase
VRRIRDVCASHGVPLRAAALQLPLLHPAVATVLAGCRSAAEVEADVADFEVEIPARLWRDLVTAELLRPDAIDS